MARAREVSTRTAAPLAQATDAGSWPEEPLRALQRAGLGGLVAPAAIGGAGLGLRALAEVCEVIGESCASTAICFGMHAVGTAVLAAKATEHQLGELLAPIAAGEHLTTLALSEPGTGAHFWLPETGLARKGDGFAVSGQKSFVTSGGHADSYVVTTVAESPEAPLGEFSCVVIPAGSPGMTWLGEWDGIGMRGNSSRALSMRDVQVPSERLLGAEGDQIWYVFEVVAPYFLVAMAGTYLGVAAAALHDVVAHLGNRRYSHTGKTLAAQPVLQHKLGRLWAEVERSRRLLYWAAEEGELHGGSALAGLSAAKAEVAECAVSVANEAMTLAGGQGYLAGSPFERHLRDARAAHIMSPTTDILRAWTGRAVLDLPLLAD